jgi:hypothetical protein
MSAKKYRRSPTSLPVDNENAILDHLRDLARRLRKQTLTTADVNRDGRIAVATLIKHHGGLGILLVKAGLRSSRIYKRDPKLMLQFLHELISKKRGRFPSQVEVTDILPFTANQYRIEFGSFQKACDLAKSFVAAACLSPKPPSPPGRTNDAENIRKRLAMIDENLRQILKAQKVILEHLQGAKGTKVS